MKPLMVKEEATQKLMAVESMLEPLGITFEDLIAIREAIGIVSRADFYDLGNLPWDERTRWEAYCEVERHDAVKTIRSLQERASKFVEGV